MTIPHLSSLINVHIAVREPGYAHKEDFYSLRGKIVIVAGEVLAQVGKGRVFLTAHKNRFNSVIADGAFTPSAFLCAQSPKCAQAAGLRAEKSFAAHMADSLNRCGR